MRLFEYATLLLADEQLQEEAVQGLYSGIDFHSKMSHLSTWHRPQPFKVGAYSPNECQPTSSPGFEALTWSLDLLTWKVELESRPGVTGTQCRKIFDGWKQLALFGISGSGKRLELLVG